MLADRVREYSLATGLGPYTLDGSVPTYRGFVDGIGIGNACYYLAQYAELWEIGIGTVTAGMPPQLSRDELIASTTGEWIDWPAGAKDLAVTAPAGLLLDRDPAGLAAALVLAHEGGEDPHPQYLTLDDGDERYAPVGSTGGGDLLAANNLSELTDVAAARGNLGLGDAATRAVGSGSGDVAAGHRGLPAGGATGQVLAKADGDDYNVHWSDPPEGGGGGSGYERAGTIVPPPEVSDWTWVNQGTATATDTPHGIRIVAPGVGGTNMRALVREAPASGDWTVTAKFHAIFPSKTWLNCALLLHDANTGRCVSFDRIGSAGGYAMRVTKYTSPTVWSADYISSLEGGNFRWRRIVRSATHLTFYYSDNGETWQPYYQSTLTDWLATVTHVGIGVEPVNQAAPQLGMTVTLESWDVQ